MKIYRGRKQQALRSNNSVVSRRYFDKYFNLAEQQSSALYSETFADEEIRKYSESYKKDFCKVFGKKNFQSLSKTSLIKRYWDKLEWILDNSNATKKRKKNWENRCDV